GLEARDLRLELRRRVLVRLRILRGGRASVGGPVVLGLVDELLVELQPQLGLRVEHGADGLDVFGCHRRERLLVDPGADQLGDELLDLACQHRHPVALDLEGLLRLAAALRAGDRVAVHGDNHSQRRDWRSGLHTVCSGRAEDPRRPRDARPQRERRAHRADPRGDRRRPARAGPAAEGRGARPRARPQPDADPRGAADAAGGGPRRRDPEPRRPGPRPHLRRPRGPLPAARAPRGLRGSAGGDADLGRAGRGAARELRPLRRARLREGAARARSREHGVPQHDPRRRREREAGEHGPAGDRAAARLPVLHLVLARPEAHLRPLPPPDRHRADRPRLGAGRADHEGARVRGPRPARRAPARGRGGDGRDESRVSRPALTTEPTRPSTDGPGPLAGVRVIELGMLLAGPFTGRLLGDMGAEIVKIEPPGQPDPMREWGRARYEGRSLWWPVQSRNKKCCTLDLRTGRGQELLLELAKQSDVLVENFRPGTLERWNLGPAELWEVNPRLVIARISGYGQTGPYAERAGFASVAEAMGGIRYINGFPGEPPPRLHISLGDSLAGMFAAQGILAALYRRDALGGGRGQVVDVSLMEACFALLESTVPEYDRLGIVRGPGGTGLKGVAPSNIFKSRDDKWMVIAANADKVFGRLCEAMGRPELATDPKFATHLARGENQEELEGIVAAWAREHDAAEIDRILNDAGVI